MGFLAPHCTQNSRGKVSIYTRRLFFLQIMQYKKELQSITGRNYRLLQDNNYRLGRYGILRAPLTVKFERRKRSRKRSQGLTRKLFFFTGYVLQEGIIKHYRALLGSNYRALQSITGKLLQGITGK